MDRPTVLLAFFPDVSGYREALELAGFEVLTDPLEAVQRMEAGRGLDLAVLDTDGAAEGLAATYAGLHANPTVPTLLLFSVDPPVFEGTAETAASDEYILKPVPPTALVYRLQASLIRTGHTLPGESGSWADADSLAQAPVAGEGHVISVFAPKGGVGKTTISVNVAVALREQTRSSVLLLDADVGVGNVTSVLQVPYRIGLADLADSPPSDWTDAAFEHVVCTHPESGLRVVTWGNDPGDSERVNVDLLLAALKWARRQHAYVVVDNHPGYDDRTMAMLTVASEILLVVTPEVGPLKNSAQFVELARQVGLADHIRVVANRANHGVKVAQMSETLGLPVLATVISNGPKAVMAANEGRPLITKFPREKISTDLHNVARLITRQTVTTTGPAGRRWWLPFASRTSQA